VPEPKAQTVAWKSLSLPPLLYARRRCSHEILLDNLIMVEQNTLLAFPILGHFCNTDSNKKYFINIYIWRNNRNVNKLGHWGDTSLYTYISLKKISKKIFKKCRSNLFSFFLSLTPCFFQKIHFLMLWTITNRTICIIFNKSMQVLSSIF